MPLTPDQIQLRKKHITGTDLAGIIGLSAYSTPLSIWQAKTGRAPEKEVTGHMRRGIIMEPAIRAAYAEEMRAHVTEPGTVISPDDDLFAATPDGIATLPCGSQVCLEIKAPGWRQGHKWGDAGTDQIPVEVVPQVMAQMAVTRLPMAHVVAWMGEGLLHYQVRFDPELWADMARIARDFWHDYVLKDTPPPVDGSAAWGDQLRAMHPTNRLRRLRPADSAAEMQVARIARARAAIAEAEAVVDDARNRLKAFIGDHDGCNGDGWTVTWKQNRSSFLTDWQAVAAAAGAGQGLIAEHTRERPGARPFLVKVAKAVAPPAAPLSLQPAQQRNDDLAQVAFDTLTAGAAIHGGAR